MKEKKKIIGFQIDSDLEEALDELSSEYGIGISGVIRMIILDYLKRYKNFKVKRKENK